MMNLKDKGQVSTGTLGNAKHTQNRTIGFFKMLILEAYAFFKLVNHTSINTSNNNKRCVKRLSTIY